MNLDDLNYDEVDTDVTKLHEQPVDIKGDPHGWRKYATCSTVYGDDTSLSWCSTQGKPRPEEKRICWEECAVRRECLAYAIAFRERTCIFGGYNFGERNVIRRRWAKDGTLPDLGRVVPDAEEVLKLILEASISTYGSTPNSLTEPVYEYDEPDETSLLSIEAEDDS